MLNADIKFLAQFYALAVATQTEFGVPALVTLSQHILEGGRENKNAHFNYFGVKADGAWKGAVQHQDTWEWHKDANQAKRYGADYIRMEPYQGGYKYYVRQNFRAYASPLEAYRDHARFLKVNPRYKACFQTTDPAEFCRRMAAAGYATDNQYAAKLVQLVDQLKKNLPLVPSPPAAQPASGPLLAAKPPVGPASS
jgi:flagellum-specific peptidoglycan hydrolase FlgJ